MLILYIATPDSAGLLDEPCQTAGLLLNKQTDKAGGVSLVHTVKTRNLSGYSMLAVDLAAIGDEETELHSAVYSVQLMYPQVRIILLALRARDGEMLKRLQQLGVENIVQTPKEIPMALSVTGLRDVQIIMRAAETPPVQERPAKREAPREDAPRPPLIIPPAQETKEAPIPEAPRGVPHTEPPSETEPAPEPESKRSRPFPFHRTAKPEEETAREPPSALERDAAPSQPLRPLRLRQHKKQAKPVTIGVCGIMRRMGTTTHALGLTAYLTGQGEAACCIEANGHGHMERFAQYYDVEGDASGVEVFAGIPLILPGVSPPESARFHIYDYGLLDDRLAAFGECDIKVLCVGSKPWELAWLGKLFQSKAAFLPYCHFIFSFTDTEEHENTLNMMGRLALKTHFSEYAPAFHDSRANHVLYRNILSEGR